jgi:hypothetical protein
VNAFGKRQAFCVAVTFVTVLTKIQCYGHDERVHKEVSASAFRSSGGLMQFLAETLGAESAPFTDRPFLSAKPPPFQDFITSMGTPYGWLLDGSYYEDMMDTRGIRVSDHFYTVQPLRIAGQVDGLTDGSESLGVLYTDIVNSFVWASTKGIYGVALSDPNIETWPDARDHQYAALTNATKARRDEETALMLYALGHVLHLNQDLSQPDHVRNDEHSTDDHRFIENYGYKTYLQNAWKSPTSWASMFPLRPRGWEYWRTNGFVTLLDFWDRNL